MQRNHRSRSFAPDVNPLEGRVVLSVGAKGAIADAVTKATSAVSLMDSGTYKKHKLESVTLMAMVSSKSAGTLTGTVTFEMVMPMKMKGMKGMKSGTTVLGTEPVSGGSASLTLKPKMVLNMPLEILYSGDTNFDSSTDTPAEVTKMSLKGTSTSTGMKM
jgi:Bacterial Ig-like domain (group 3)